MADRRERGEGSWLVDSKGRYGLRISYIDPLTGRRKRPTIWGETKGAARKEAQKTLEKVAHGEAIPGRTPYLKEYIERWLERRRAYWKHNTYARHAGIFERWITPVIGEVRVHAATPEHVEMVMAQMHEQGMSPRTQNYARTLLSGLFKSAMRDNLALRNVASLSEPVRERRFNVEPFTAAELKTFLDGVAGDRDYPLLLTAAMLGLRQSELLGLRWENVDLARGKLRVTETLQRENGAFVLSTTKTETSVRELAIPSLLAAALEAHREQQQLEQMWAGKRWFDRAPWNDLVFRTQYGSPRNGTALTRRFQELLGTLGLRKIRFHDLRHTTATILRDRGVTIEDIRDTLGHSSTQITAMIYAHQTVDAKERVADTMQQLFGGAE